ncbi:hypothetical protein CIB48_g5407 [Xylaria polymorpha]|nr:hypothetical protein CIB48_g5407 [Xylaria polymorpha]
MRPGGIDHMSHMQPQHELRHKTVSDPEFVSLKQTLSIACDRPISMMTMSNPNPNPTRVPIRPDQSTARRQTTGKPAASKRKFARMPIRDTLQYYGVAR